MKGIGGNGSLEILVIVLLVVVIILIGFQIIGLGQGYGQVVKGIGSADSPIFNILPSPVLGGGDDRYSRAPRPQRVWDNGPELPIRGAFGSQGPTLDSIATRGAPEAYQQMGVIVGPDNKPLPLYGRRTAPRSDKFNYYTRTDQYNPVALPLLFNKRDCQDNVGCDEVMNGDNIKLGATGEVAKVTLYGFDGPRYA
jgi:Family of unknown function (DUF5755)